jgi:uncharacterized protein DUF7025
LLYNYAPKLKAYQHALDPLPENETPRKDLAILVDFINETYASTSERLNALLKGGQITYDLLWALFKPSIEVYTQCKLTDRPRCMKCVSGEEKERQDKTQYYRLECQFLEWDGKILGESRMVFEIEKFSGARQINHLGVFPLRYHPTEIQLRAQLIDNGRKFLSLRGIHHVEYNGLAFRQNKMGILVSISIIGRIMIDTAFLRQMNPEFPVTKPFARKPKPKGGFFHIDDLFSSKSKESGQVMSADLDPKDMSEDDLLICSHIVHGYSLRHKVWGKNIYDY